ncbi:hypothetical protein N7454_001395 [Penicillium verhagenii]|nr:hypothetical protein N7454_001395 [Penicillium verhagenii]
MNVRPTQSSPFHPTCPFRNRLKKALRLIRNRKSSVLRLVPGSTQLVPKLHGREYQLQHPRVLSSRREDNVSQKSCPNHKP